MRSPSYPDWLQDCQQISYTVWGGPEPFKTILDIGSPDYSDLPALIRYLNCWRINFPFFFFSFGFADRLERDVAPVFERLLKEAARRGLHPVTYLKANSLFATSFFNPDLGGLPEAREWIHTTPRGWWYPYWIYPDRYLVCVGHEGWFEKYLLPKAKHAIDCGAEGIFLDNIEAGALCYCEKCKRRFRERLKEKVSSAELAARGVDADRFDPASLVDGDFHTLAEFEHGKPEIGVGLGMKPGVSEPAKGYWAKADWKDPLWQEWILLHTEQLSSMLNRLSEAIKRYGKERYGRDILLSNNFGGFRNYRLCAAKGIWFEDVDVDLYLFEWNYPVTVAERLALQAQCPGKKVVSYGKKFLYAFGDVWFPSIDNSDPVFPRRMAEYMIGYRSRAEAGIVFSVNSVVWDGKQKDWETCVEELLPWLPVEGVSLAKAGPEDLARYRALVLPNASCLSDAEAEKLAGYLKAGGHVFFAPDTGRLDERGKPRLKPALEAIAARLAAGERARLRGFDGPAALSSMLRRLPFEVSAVAGAAEVLTIHVKEDRSWPKVLRIVSPKGLRLKLRAWEGWDRFGTCAIGQEWEHRGKVPIPPRHEGGFLYYDIPDCDGLVLFVLEEQKTCVLLEVSQDEVWLSREPWVQATLTVQNANPKPCDVELHAAAFEDHEGGWETQIVPAGAAQGGGGPAGVGPAAGGPSTEGASEAAVGPAGMGPATERAPEAAVRLHLAPHEKRELSLVARIRDPDTVVPLHSTIVVDAHDPGQKPGRNRCALKVRRRAFAMTKFPLSANGPECPPNPDSAGSGAVVFGERGVILAKTSGLCVYRGMSYRELMKPQEVSRHGPIIGLVTQWPRYQARRYVRADVRFSPGLSSYLVSDRIYDQNQLDRSSERQEAVSSNLAGHSLVRFTFSQPPFEVTETIAAQAGDPCFYVSYHFRALHDGTIYQWYVPRVGIPGSRVEVGGALAEKLCLGWQDEESGRALILALYSLSPYDSFSRGQPVIEESPYRFDNPVLCLPVTAQTVLEVRTGDTYQFDFALIPLPTTEGGELGRALDRLVAFPRGGASAILEANLDAERNRLFLLIDSPGANSIRVLKRWRRPRVLAANGTELPVREGRDIHEFEVPAGRTALSISERS